MTRALAKVRADKLRAQTRCPVCGADRIDALGKSGTPSMYCVYACSAEFQVDGNGEIIPATICPASSYVAARSLNDEAKAEARRQAGAA